MFDLERKRWEAKSLIEEQTMKRVKFEREQAQLEAYTTQQKLVEKRKQLEELLGEMERLDGELKEVKSLLLDHSVTHPVPKSNCDF